MKNSKENDQFFIHNLVIQLAIRRLYRPTAMETPTLSGEHSAHAVKPEMEILVKITTSLKDTTVLDGQLSKLSIEEGAALLSNSSGEVLPTAAGATSSASSEEMTSGQEIAVVLSERIREKENDFAKRLVDCAQMLAHHELGDLEAMAVDLSARADG